MSLPGFWRLDLLAAMLLHRARPRLALRLDRAADAYRYTFKALSLLGAGPALVLLLCSPELFDHVSGASWRPAGELAQILAPLCFLIHPTC